MRDRIEAHDGHGASLMLRLLVVAGVIMALTAMTGTAQESPLATPRIGPATPAISSGPFGGWWASPATENVELRPRVASGIPPGEFAGGALSTQDATVHLDRIRTITLEQVKQQSANRALTNPLARLAQLQIEAARQHRRGLQADYFPKLGAAFANLHYSEFLGNVVTVRRPILGLTAQVPVPLFSQNWTIAAVTFTQPITPLFQVYQAVRIARADERIAMAKAGVPIAKNTSDAEIEAAYFRLLIAQCRLVSARSKLRNTERRPEYVTVSNGPGGAPGRDLDLVAASKALATAASEVKTLTASLNRIMGWPEDTELELVPPAPLVEDITLDQVADKSAAANPKVIEAGQTVVKARAASVLSKLAYVPTVAATGGYLFQNAIPLTPSNFGYGGVVASFTLFDFGKREAAVKEARVQLEMAEIALQLTKAKAAANLKKSYFELERTRQLSQVALKMGSSLGYLMKASSSPDSIETKAARADVEAEMLEADLAHRQAYARLKTLMGSER